MFVILEIGKVARRRCAAAKVNVATAGRIQAVRCGCVLTYYCNPVALAVAADLRNAGTPVCTAVPAPGLRSRPARRSLPARCAAVLPPPVVLAGGWVGERPSIGLGSGQ